MFEFQLLIGLHATLGQIGLLFFLWATVEIATRTDGGLARTQKAVTAGVILIFFAWLFGGYYYLTHYGNAVKAVIQTGSAPWIHGVFMETKEHVFLFLPFLSLAILLVIRSVQQWDELPVPFWRALVMLCLVLETLGFSMAGMGFLISAGARAATGGGV